MDNIQWKDSDIYNLNMDRYRLISESLCVWFEELAAYLFINQTEICRDESIVKKFVLKGEDIADQMSFQAIKKYISLEKRIDISISFTCNDYQMYYLSSWITRKLCDIAKNNSDDLFDDFFVNNFSKANVSYKNLKCLEKFSKQIKIYSIEIQKFKFAIFEYMNDLIGNKYFYCSDGVTFDLSKITLFVNLWGIIKSYYYCQNPISTSNKYLFSKLIRDFFRKNDKLEHHLSGMNLAFMDFSETDLSEIILDNIDFTQTNFYNTNLDSSTFDRVTLKNANFESAFMEVSKIYDSNCSGALFKGSHLLATVIENSNLSGVDFCGTNLMECDIINSCLANVKFDENTALNSSTFVNSSLSQIDLTGISISQEQMRFFWENTTGIKDIKIYDNDFRRLAEDEKQAELYKSLVESIDEYLIQNEFSKKSLDIFISHSTLEKLEIARPIYSFLEKNEYSTWIDDVNVEEDKLRLSIELGIQNCQSAIIILSDIYKTRAWTRYELLRIIQESKKRRINVIIIAYHLADIKDCPEEFQKIVIQDTVEEEFWNKLLNLLLM